LDTRPCMRQDNVQVGNHVSNTACRGCLLGVQAALLPRGFACARQGYTVLSNTHTVILNIYSCG
jgi:hypothetical protein